MENKEIRITYSDQLFQFRAVESKKLIFSLTITSIVMVIEIVGGFITIV
ncbi:MAG: hypothetical protein R3255_06950 [Candidatus Lokiarchaeia archaeon]|nr:hypothetical protein [Candidatus Lokiarchaeia archaeon]